MLEWIVGVLPVLGLTGNWRGYRMGGKAIGGANMPTDLKKKFEAARAAGKVDEAKTIADKVQKFNDDKKAEKAKTIVQNKTKSSLTDSEIDKLKPVMKEIPANPRLYYSTPKKVELYDDLIGVEHFNGASDAKYRITVYQKANDAYVPLTTREPGGGMNSNNRELGYYRTKKGAVNAVKDFLKSGIEFSSSNPSLRDNMISVYKRNMEGMSGG